jgi:hypothetical protein
MPILGDYIINMFEFEFPTGTGKADLMLSSTVIAVARDAAMRLARADGPQNAVRTHLSLGKDAPVRRIIQFARRIEARPILGGLPHQYMRI